MPRYGVRRAGDGNFYIVTMDENGNSHEVYENKKLIKFEASEDAKEYIKEISTLNKPIGKRKGRIL